MLRTWLGARLFNATPITLLLMLLAGCASSGMSELAGHEPAVMNEHRRIVQAGDRVDIHYLCRLQSGEIIAATDSVPEDQPQSNIFVRKTDMIPLALTATKSDQPYIPKKEEPFEIEILNRLSGKVTGMQEGETRIVEVKAQDIPKATEQNYIVHLARVRTRPKEMRFTLSEYRNRTHTAPEVGQTFAVDPSFPGTVTAVTDQDVVVMFFAKPGDVVKTPFGSGLIREEGPDYKIDINARKGGLTRAGAMIGRIVDVDEKTITVDYRNPFGYETLTCEVTVEKIADEKLTVSGTGE
jgi:FKBP-type peptidyl-prolyl cis-trans isomerase 2